MTASQTISDELKGQLQQVFALGFLDAVKGEEATDDDQITQQFGNQIKVMAEAAIDNAEAAIAPLITENPTEVYRAVYSVGFEAATQLIETPEFKLRVQQEINLN